MSNRNAGSFGFVGPLWEADPKVWREDVTVNLYGTMLCCRFVRAAMTESLISTPQKQAWQPHVSRLMGSEQEMPPDACARATLRLLHIAGPALSGCVFGVHTDFEDVARRRAVIREQNLCVMRRWT